ncbi:restriction endonuclease subunit S [Aeromonas sp. 55A]|uniref:restriction endonuclease subunit S n=1 Tax=Aeromonas sp. 55A TaxID=3452720 RepID=UPI003F7B0D20
MSHFSYMEKLLDGVGVELKTLGWVGEVRMCKRIMKNQTSDIGDIPFFKIGTFGKEPNAYISRKIFHEYKEKYSYPRIGEVLISASGTIGRTVIFDGREAYFQDSNIVWLENDESKVLNKYLFHFYKIAKWGVSNGGVISRLYNDNIKKTLIPIPCPDNPEKSLAIQAEIVSILDAFNELVTELTVELNIRKKQFSHYQFEIFKFEETTQYLKIGECCDIKKGLTPIKKATPGKYPLVATTAERQSSSEYQFDDAAVCVPLISSRGHGVASIDRIYYQDGKFALGNILCAIIPNDSRFLSAKFLRYYLFDKKDVLLVPLMRGGANVSLTVDSLKKVEIPIPPMAIQIRIVRILEKFDELLNVLPREIELRQKQYEYYRDLLLSFPKSHSDEAA